MISVKDVLIAARAKIANPSNWTQRVFAMDAKGEVVDPTNPRACKWCAAGAIIYAKPEGSRSAPYFEPLRKAIDSFVLARFNDTHTHAEVLAAFDKAIAGEKS